MRHTTRRDETHEEVDRREPDPTLDPRPGARAAKLLALQRAAGNHAVARLVPMLLRQQPAPDGGAPPAPDGGAPKLPAWATDDFKRKFAATILAEAWEGQETEIGWVYFNLCTAAGGEAGLERSAAYKGKGIWFKIWLHLLGDTTYGKDGLPKQKDFEGYKSVADFCTRNEWVKKKAETRGKAVRDQLDKMLTDPASNPMKGWTGQGNLADLNNESNSDVYWTKVRAYYQLQLRDKTVPELVKMIGSGKNRQVVFNGDAIGKYWEKNKLPATVPKVE